MLTPVLILLHRKGKINSLTLGQSLTSYVDEKRLAMSGRCHDWATDTKYTLLTDKFLARTILIYLRWLTLVWLAVAFLLFMCSDLPFLSIGYLLVVLLLLSSLFDLLNSHEDEVKSNQATIQGKLSHRGNWYYLLKEAIIAILCLFVHTSVPSYTRCFDFFFLVIASMCSSFIVHTVLSNNDQPKITSNEPMSDLDTCGVGKESNYTLHERIKSD